MSDQERRASAETTPAPRQGSVVRERWVNARIEVVIPLDDVTVNHSKWDKQEASGRALDRLIDALPKDMQEYVASASWEDSDA